MRARITKRSVEAARPAARDLFVWDAELKGFGLKITPKGKKVFVVQYVPRDQPAIRRRVSLGAFGPVTVEGARETAAILLGRVAGGEDPGQTRAEARRTARETTVALMSAEYLEYVRAHFKPRTAELYGGLFRLYILPALATRPVSQVTVRDVTALHMEHKKKPTTANRIVQVLKSFLYWCEKQGLRAPHSNPCRNVTMYPEHQRERFLTVEEMSRLGQALRVAETAGLPPAPEHRYKRKGGTETEKHRPGNADDRTPANPFAVNAIRFLLFSGWREQEALTLKWRDVDTTRGLATLPATKTGKSIRALGAPALELLDSLPRVSGSPYVFPGSKPGQPLKDVRRVWHAARYAADLAGVRLHDLRHTTASFAGGSGFSVFMIGKLLGHKTARSTERYAHLADDARRAMADVVAGAMAAALDGKVAKVIPLKAAR